MAVAYATFANGGTRYAPEVVAGVAGTADTAPGKEPTGWFVGFGPVSGPQDVVAWAIDQAGYGAGTCAPVVNAIFDDLAKDLVGPPAVPPDPAVVASTAPVPPPPSPTQLTIGQALAPGQT